MANNGIDWEGLTSKPMEDITLDDKITVIVGKLINIEKRTAKVPIMESFYRVMVFCTPIIMSILVAVLLLVINHISHAG